MGEACDASIPPRQNKFGTMTFLKPFFHTLLFVLLSAVAHGQIHGVITDAETGDPIPGANIHWSETTIGTVSDVDGKFSLKPVGDFPLRLVVSYVGYTADTLKIKNPQDPVHAVLSSSVNMHAVQVTENRGASTMSATSKLNAETINRGILRKAACCNLSESFETTASVDVVMNDAVTGTRKIRMLGLDGIYVQNLFEGIPFTGGLGNVLGFDQIPGPWIESIAITKGVGSVVNGYESMTGQINLEFIKPDDPEMTYFDVFANHRGRVEANVIRSVHLSERLSTALFLSGQYFDHSNDENNDGFLDSPRRKGVKVMNRWKYIGDNFRSQLSGAYTHEERTSGQTDFTSKGYQPEDPHYGFGFGVDQWEVFAKNGILFPNREDRSIGITALASGIDMESYFGRDQYLGEQRTLRLNALYVTNLSKYGDHSLEAGGHFLYDSFNEQYADSGFTRIERVPGVSAEYTYDRPRFTLVAGARYDQHNIYGGQFSPRLHLKYNIKPLTTVRIAGGRGFRSANAFADRLGILASSRRIEVQDSPGIESSWNAGLSFLHKFELFDREAVFNTDYFYTVFEDRLVVDRDHDPRILMFYNLDGRSDSHSFQADLQAEPLPGLGVKVSYKYQQSKVDYIDGREDMPLMPRHRALGNIGYTSPKGLWYIDFTANYYGVSRLPNTAANPEPFRLGTESKDYFIFNSQITRTLGDFEVYVGVENLGNFIQSDAIVDAENPFGEYFDATMIYGPLDGRTFYGGIRYTRKNAK